MMISFLWVYAINVSLCSVFADELDFFHIIHHNLNLREFLSQNAHTSIFQVEQVSFPIFDEFFYVFSIRNKINIIMVAVDILATFSLDWGTQWAPVAMTDFALHFDQSNIRVFHGQNRRCAQARLNQYSTFFAIWLSAQF